MKWNHITENQSNPYHLDNNSNKRSYKTTTHDIIAVLLINKCVDHITIKNPNNKSTTKKFKI